MKWFINISDKESLEIQKAINYCKSFLENYNTSKLEYVRIDHGRADYKTFYGRCRYPKDKNSKYKVSCQINQSIEFPFKRLQRRSPLYFIKKDEEISCAHEKYEELKNNSSMKLGMHCQAINNGLLTSWVRIYELVTYNNFAECIVSIFAHEIGHFLSRTKQIPYKNTEIEIDKFEDKILNEYRNA